MTDTTTHGNLYAQVAEAANRIERASIIAHWASPADAEYHAERARTAFCEMAALLGYTVSKTGEDADSRLLKELKVERGIYAMQAQPYTARALDKIIKEFEATS